MTMCHRTNCAPSSLVFMLNRRSEKLKPYVILNPEEHCVQEGKTSAQQQLLKLLNKTGSTGVSPLSNPFTHRDVSTPAWQ